MKKVFLNDLNYYQFTEHGFLTVDKVLNDNNIDAYIARTKIERTGNEHIFNGSEVPRLFSTVHS